MYGVFAVGTDSDAGVCCSRTALTAVSRVAKQAFRFTSVPRARISRRPNINCELAATKPRTTPEPVPTSTTRGDVDVLCVLLAGAVVGVLLKRFESHVDSDSEESVSRKR